MTRSGAPESSPGCPWRIREGATPTPKKIGQVLKNGERRHRDTAKTRKKEATMFLLELILDLLDWLEDEDMVIREKF